MASMSRLKRLRHRLHAKDPRCHWCKQVTVLIEAGPRHKHFPDNAATVDHLFSRWHPDRQRPNDGRKRYVLACRKCNNERGAAEERAAGIEELRRRAKTLKRGGDVLDWTETQRGRLTPIQWPPRVEQDVHQ